MQAGNDFGSLGGSSDDDVGRGEPDFPPAPSELQYLIEPAIHYGREYKKL
jgi:hypothetical protein